MQRNYSDDEIVQTFPEDYPDSAAWVAYLERVSQTEGPIWSNCGGWVA